MINLDFLNQYLVIVVAGICLCTGYVIKTSLDFIPNKYIPLIMLILGTAVNLLINWEVSADIILGGMASGLSSTGLYEAYRNLLHGGSKESQEQQRNKEN